MNKKFKKLSLMLLLAISILPLSGCGNKDDSSTDDSQSAEVNAFDELADLDVKAEEVTLDQAFLDSEAAKGQSGAGTNLTKPTLKVTITNKSKNYFNNAPVGLITDKDSLKQEDLEDKNYDMVLVPLILAPKDSNTFYIETEKGENKITLSPYFETLKDYDILQTKKDPYTGSGNSSDDKSKDKDDSKNNKKTSLNIKSDSKNDKNAKDESTKEDTTTQDRDQEYVDKYISSDSDSSFLYPGDIELGTPTQQGASEESKGLSISAFDVKISNNGDTELKIKKDDVLDVVRYGIFVEKNNKVYGMQLIVSETDISIAPGDSGTISVGTIATGETTPTLYFNGYSSGKSNKDKSDEKDKGSSDKDSDTDKNKDKKQK